MKKGFTLIELLAVIVLLGVIGLIVVPSVNNTIKSSKEKALEETISNLENAAYLYTTDNYVGYPLEEQTLSFETLLNDGYIKKLPIDSVNGGNLKGCILYSWKNNQYSYRYDKDCISQTPTLITLDVDFEEVTAPNDNGWHNGDFYVRVTVSGDSLSWCSTTSDTCNPTSLVDKNTNVIYITNESISNKICVIGYKGVDYTDVVCSNNYKLDKTAPSISVSDITVSKNSTIDLSEYTTNDNLSGVDNITYDPTNIDTSTAGVKTVTYTVTDKAGNTSSIDRHITVTSDKPTVNFTTLTSPNGNGWFNSGFYIKSQATSDSSTSISNIKWCSTASTSCTPTSVVESDNATAYITSNSTNNKMCVIATDATGISSDVVCSNNYKLDSTTPTLTAISSDVSITEGDSNLVSSYFNTPSYGISGGSLSCSPNNTSGLSVGTQAVSCTATSNSGLSKTTSKNITVNVAGPYIASKGVNAPQLTSGMTPIKWNGTTEVTTTSDDPDWYNYGNKMWANAKTTDGSYWVWIPRYAYKITSGWHTITAGTINVIFLKNDTQDNTSEITIQTSGYSTTGTNTSNAYFLHPAFQNSTGNTKYGMWVAKFEASNTTALPKSVPNVSSLRSVTIGDMFTASSNMASNVSYGWNNVETHMMTNYEWGAVAYLTQSIYGKNSEVWINNSSTYITGCAGNSVSEKTYEGCQNAYNTTKGVNASTTGNITGIYDMSGGACEYTAAYVNSGNSNLTTCGNSIISSSINKNVYSITTDSQENNYNANKNMYGDAVYETSSSYSGTGWNSDYSYMPNSGIPWFIRGGYYYSASTAGVFSFSYTSGGASGYIGFRPVVLPLQ